MAFATVSELQARLEWVLSEKEVGVAEDALEDLTLEAKFYGRLGWTEAKHPPLVKSIILKAAARFMRNYEAFEESRAGDETVGFMQGSVEPGTPEFTEKEILQIRTLAAAPGFGTINVYTWGVTDKPRDYMAPMQDKDIPFISGEDRRWYESWERDG